jgi:four helix bundle protein
MEIYSYKKLIVWQKSIKLAIDIYKITEYYPSSEIYGITSQMRRSSVSISSNIAEGRSRISRRQFAQFLIISHGSLCELETQIEISKNLSFTNNLDFTNITSLINEVKAMLGSMIRKLSPLVKK